MPVATCPGCVRARVPPHVAQERQADQRSGGCSDRAQGAGSRGFPARTNRLDDISDDLIMPSRATL